MSDSIPDGTMGDVMSMFGKLSAAIVQGTVGAWLARQGVQEHATWEESILSIQGGDKQQLLDAEKSLMQTKGELQVKTAEVLAVHEGSLAVTREKEQLQLQMDNTKLLIAHAEDEVCAVASPLRIPLEFFTGGH